jgi:UrcA family protein
MMRNINFERSVRLAGMANAAVIGLSAFVIAQPSIAKERPVVVVAETDLATRSISFADLDLASSPGEVILSRRVRGAINSLCLETTGSDGRFWTLENDHCQTSAWKQADPQIVRAVQRARDIALSGTSAIAATAITIALAK